MDVKTKTITIENYTFRLSVSTTTPNTICSGSFLYKGDPEIDMTREELEKGQSIQQDIFNGKYNKELFSTVETRKVAKLVYASFVVRVVVDDTASEDDIIQQSKQQFIDTINGGLGDHVEDIKNDVECPYDPERD